MDPGEAQLGDVGGAQQPVLVFHGASEAGNLGAGSASRFGGGRKKYCDRLSEGLSETLQRSGAVARGAGGRAVPDDAVHCAGGGGTAVADRLWKRGEFAAGAGDGA